MHLFLPKWLPEGKATTEIKDILVRSQPSETLDNIGANISNLEGVTEKELKSELVEVIREAKKLGDSHPALRYACAPDRSETDPHAGAPRSSAPSRHACPSSPRSRSPSQARQKLGGPKPSSPHARRRSSEDADRDARLRHTLRTGESR